MACEKCCSNDVYDDNLDWGCEYCGYPQPSAAAASGSWIARMLRRLTGSYSGDARHPSLSNTEQ